MIRLINTTTCLPIDKDIEDSFFSVIKPNFVSAIMQRNHANYVDVQFVNQDDLDLERKKLKEIEEEKSESYRDDVPENNIPDIDLLGVYFPHHPVNHCPVIKVSPEKVMDFCLSLRAKHGVVLPLKTLYPTILNAVVIHELAHWLMDKDSVHSQDHCKMPWEWLIDARLEDDPQYNFHNRGEHCHFHGKDISPKLRQWRDVVEESLANAFVLKQKFKADELDALLVFMELQPSAYQAGLRWRSNLAGLLNTAASWSDFKGGVIGRRGKDLMFSEPNHPLEVLVKRLLSGKESIGSFDFKTEFYKHKVSRLPTWQQEFEKDKTKWDDFLNGTFGILDELSAHESIFGKRIKTLQQWAANGSARGVDKLNKALSDEAEEKGEFGEALKFQQARLANLVNSKDNDYWRKKHSDEIHNAIARLNNTTNCV